MVTSEVAEQGIRLHTAYAAITTHYATSELMKNIAIIYKYHTIFSEKYLGEALEGVLLRWIVPVFTEIERWSLLISGQSRWIGVTDGWW